ncbi:MAG TPA: ester cyclase [Candidatus Sulfotelmatobacter sp.]
MPVEENIQLMQRWFQEVWNEGRIQTIYDLLASNAVAKGQSGGESEIRGPEEFARFVQQIRAAFRDVKLQVEDIFGAKDEVVIRWSAVMTHTGDAFGVSATGKSVRTRGVTIARIENGKIIEGWDNWDQLGMLEQIGALQRIQPAILAETA